MTSDEPHNLTLESFERVAKQNAALRERVAELTKRNHELTEALVCANSVMNNASAAMKRGATELAEAATAAYRAWDKK